MSSGLGGDGAFTEAESAGPIDGVAEVFLLLGEESKRAEEEW